MMDNSKLYRAVFDREKPYIDTNNTSTAVINCGWNEERYQTLIGELDRRIGSSWYQVLDFSPEVNRIQLEFAVMGFEQNQFNHHYLLLLEHKNCTSEQAKQSIERIINTITGTSGQGQKMISAILILDTDRIENIDKGLMDLLNKPGIDVFLYNEIEETKGFVINACLGVVIARCYKAECDLGKIKTKTIGAIENNRTVGFSADTDIGKLIAEDKVPSLGWLSISCRCADQSTDYLNACMSHLLNNGMMKLDNEIFYQAANEFYDDYFRHVSVEKKHLLRAIDNIPMVTLPAVEQEQYKLERYFRDSYGESGIMIVDLSLKITMAKNLSVSNTPEEDADKALSYIYKKIGHFGSENLHGYVINCLSEYKNRLENLYNTETSALRDLLDKSSANLKEMLAGYVDKYQAIFLLRKRIEFWEYVAATYSTERWKAFNDESANIAVQIAQMKDELRMSSTQDNYGVIGQLNRMYTPYELLHPEACPELCELLRSEYKPIPFENMANRNVNDLRWLFFLNQHPSFQSEDSASFITGDQRYQISIAIKSGKYLIAT